MFIKIFNILLLLNSLETNTVDLPKARQVIIGQKGAGKSNVINRDANECNDCTFAVCGNDSCTFMTVGEVLEENQELKDEIKWLNDVITNNISNLEERIEANLKDIMRNTDSVATISAATAKNTHDILTQGDSIAANADNIAKNTLDVTSNSENIVQNSASSAKNADDIEDIRSQIEDAYATFDSLPLGTIISWTPYPDKNTQNPSDIPQGWMLCDGSEIKEGPWAGHWTPDINNSKRFLRGSIVADALKTEEDSVNTDGLTVTDNAFHTYGCPDGTTWVGGTGTGTCNTCDSDSYCQHTQSVNGGASETKPININVAFIIKINS